MAYRLLDMACRLSLIWHAASLIWHAPLPDMARHPPPDQVLMLASINLPIPNGCFMPIFVIGAIIGRLYGEIVHDVLGPSVAHLPTAYFSVIGAAALTAGATQGHPHTAPPLPNMAHASP
eukprot:3468993-Prymnesium_polylepis.1